MGVSWDVKDQAGTALVPSVTRSKAVTLQTLSCFLISQEQHSCGAQLVFRAVKKPEELMAKSYPKGFSVAVLSL